MDSYQVCLMVCLDTRMQLGTMYCLLPPVGVYGMSTRWSTCCPGVPLPMIQGTYSITYQDTVPGRGHSDWSIAQCVQYIPKHHIASHCRHQQEAVNTLLSYNCYERWYIPGSQSIPVRYNVCNFVTAVVVMLSFSFCHHPRKSCF